MEELLHRSCASQEPFSEEMLLLLTAFACFLPRESQIMVSILLKGFEILNLLNERRNLTPCDNRSRPSMEQALTQIRQLPGCHTSPELSQLTSMLDMALKIMQMKDLMEALREMPGTCTDSAVTGATAENSMNFSPDMLEKMLPPQQQTMFHMLQEMLKQNPSGEASADHSAVCSPAMREENSGKEEKNERYF